MSVTIAARRRAALPRRTVASYALGSVGDRGLRHAARPRPRVLPDGHARRRRRAWRVSSSPSRSSGTSSSTRSSARGRTRRPRGTAAAARSCSTGALTLPLLFAAVFATPRALDGLVGGRVGGASRSSRRRPRSASSRCPTSRCRPRSRPTTRRGRGCWRRGSRSSPSRSSRSARADRWCATPRAAAGPGTRSWALVGGVSIGLGMLAAWWGAPGGRGGRRAARPSRTPQRRGEALRLGAGGAARDPRVPPAARRRSCCRRWPRARCSPARSTSRRTRWAPRAPSRTCSSRSSRRRCWSCPLATRLARRFGKKRVVRRRVHRCSRVAALSLLPMRWAPGGWVYASVALAGVAYAGMQLYPLAMLPDVVAVDARERGEDRAGVLGGVWTAGETAGLALGPTLVLGMLAVTGFVSRTGDEMVTQPGSALTGIVARVLAAARGARAAQPRAAVPLPVVGGRRRRTPPAGGPPRSTDREHRPHPPPTSSPTSPAWRAADPPTHGGRDPVLRLRPGPRRPRRRRGRGGAHVPAGQRPGPDDVHVGRRAREPARRVRPRRAARRRRHRRVGDLGRHRVLHARGEVGPRPVARGRPGAAQARPTLVLPTTAHPAFHKAAHYLDLDVVAVPVDPAHGRADGRGRPRAGRRADRAGRRQRAELPVRRDRPGRRGRRGAASAASRARRRVHRRLGAAVVGRDRRSRGTSRSRASRRVSADLHKFGYAPKGASVVLYRAREQHRAQYFATTAWPGYPVVNPTMLGSRGVGSMAAAWAVLQVLGTSGLRELVAADAARRPTRWSRPSTGIAGLRVVGSPTGPLVAIATDEAVDRRRRGSTRSC